MVLDGERSRGAYPEATGVWGTLVHPEKSSFYNPLIGEDPQILVERVFNAFNITNEFYRKVQYQWLSQIICLLTEIGEKGETIKKECNTCHLFLSEKLSGVMSAETALGKPFEHPVNVGGEERRSTCNTCHAGR